MTPVRRPDPRSSPARGRLHPWTPTTPPPTSPSTPGRSLRGSSAGSPTGRSRRSTRSSRSTPPAATEHRACREPPSRRTEAATAGSLALQPPPLLQEVQQGHRRGDQEGRGDEDHDERDERGLGRGGALHTAARSQQVGVRGGPPADDESRHGQPREAPDQPSRTPAEQE